MHQPLPRKTSSVPPLIKRNTVFFALSQSFIGVGTQLGYGMGPLMVVSLTGSASLAGLTVGLFGISRFLVSYPVGKITDTYGRKPGIQLGLGMTLVGTLVVGISMLLHGIVGLIVGMLIFGMGFNAAQQLRVAATDMYPPRLRALALGFVAAGAMLGLLIAPVLMWIAEFISKAYGLEQIALPWLMVPTLLLVGMALVTFVNPDPREIGMNLQRYYPDYVPPPKRSLADTPDEFSIGMLLRHTPTRLAIISNCAGQGNMAIVMVLTSLVLSHHGHTLTAIALSHMFHGLGMFGFTVPIGRLADRIGREQVMYPGVAMTLVGAIFVTFGSEYWSVTVGTFLVGLGWAAANVASTALIADLTETVHRGRAIGVSDSGAGIMTLLAAVVTGPLIECTSLPAAGIAAAAVAGVPLLLFAHAYMTRPRTEDV